jgi:hypothetical protein
MSKAVITVAALALGVLIYFAVHRRQEAKREAVAASEGIRIRDRYRECTDEADAQASEAMKKAANLSEMKHVVAVQSDARKECSRDITQ